MKTKAADTSIQVYHSEIKGDKEKGQNEKVLEAIRKLEPATGRQISQLTAIENSAVARCLNNLKRDKKIEVYFNANCRITGRPAQHYRLYVKPEPAEPGVQSRMNF